jgi:WD40 repeat protein
MIPTTRGVVAAVFSPDGAQVATADGNGATIWDTATGKRIRNLASHNELILALAFAGEKWERISKWGIRERLDG